MHLVLKWAAQSIAVAAAVALGGCDRPAVASGAVAAAPEAVVAQYFEITIDGQTMVLSPDNPKVSVVSATVMRAGTGLALSVLDKSRNLSFGLIVADSVIAPGDFPIGECGRPPTCGEHSKTAVLGPYPDGRPPDPASASVAYDYAELGLQPLVLSLAKVEDVQWPGVGPAKRLQGTFKGRLARLERRGADGRDQVVGPVRQVEGRFDLYAALR